MAAEGLITFDELGVKLAGLEKTQQTVRRELEALSKRQEAVETLERACDTLFASYARMVEDLDKLTSEQRHHICKMLRLRVVLRLDAKPEVS